MTTTALKIALALSWVFSFVSAQGKNATWIRERYIEKDVPHIACPVCRIQVEEMLRLTITMRDHAPYKKLSEWYLDPMFDGICDPDSKYGKWLSQTNIATAYSEDNHNERELQVYLDAVPGKCGKECLTVAKSCKILMDDDVDRDELSALLYSNKLSREALVVIK